MNELRVTGFIGTTTVIATICGVAGVSSASTISSISLTVTGELGGALAGHSFEYQQIHTGEQTRVGAPGTPQSYYGQGDLFTDFGWVESEATSMLRIFDSDGEAVIEFAFDGYDDFDAEPWAEGSVRITEQITFDGAIGLSVSGVEYASDGDMWLALFSWAPATSDQYSSLHDIMIIESLSVTDAAFNIPGIGFLDAGQVIVTGVDVAVTVIPLPTPAFLALGGLGIATVARRRLMRA